MSANLAAGTGCGRLGTIVSAALARANPYPTAAAGMRTAPLRTRERDYQCLPSGKDGRWIHMLAPDICLACIGRIRRGAPGRVGDSGSDPRSAIQKAIVQHARGSWAESGLDKKKKNRFLSNARRAPLGALKVALVLRPYPPYGVKTKPRKRRVHTGSQICRAAEIGCPYRRGRLTWSTPSTTRSLFLLLACQCSVPPRTLASCAHNTDILRPAWIHRQADNRRANGTEIDFPRCTGTGDTK